MAGNSIGKVNHNERVTSTYADIYLNDEYCDNDEDEITVNEEKIDTISRNKFKSQGLVISNMDWTSPSDLLIGKVELVPPFTSKITRGVTHEGILKIGGEVLDAEYATFLKNLNEQLNDNEGAWQYILQNEREIVKTEVALIYDKIFQDKSKIMAKEMSKFYENTLNEVEKHVTEELDNLLIASHSKIISHLNVEIKNKLDRERKILEANLTRRYLSEVKKLNIYYDLLLKNELYRYSLLISKATHERNDALKAFYKSIDNENITSTMYVMSTERKKCKIKRFLLEKVQSEEIKEKLKNVKKRSDLITGFKQREETISDINKKCEEKVRKVLKLFLKFISFSLKLLPDQATFLLDLEKMVVLQLNEIQKHPENMSNILFDIDEFENIIQFPDIEQKDSPCDKKPFILIGDLSPLEAPVYGSRETLPSNVDLPMIQIVTDRFDYIYAKCHGFEAIKALIESQYCKCINYDDDIQQNEESSSVSKTDIPSDDEVKLEEESATSSLESILIDDIDVIQDCPSRKCYDWVKRYSFPSLNQYFDFTEEKFERVKTMLGNPKKPIEIPEILNPKDIVMTKLPFSETNEPFHHVETQYSSQEDLKIDIPPCTCVNDSIVKGSTLPVIDTTTNNFDKIMSKRKISLTRIIQNNSNLLKMFTDEYFNF